MDDPTPRPSGDQKPRRKPGPRNSGKRKINPETAELRRRALELKIAGLTFDSIAKQLGLKGGSGSAHRVCQEAIRDIYREPADEFRTLELERIERLHRTYWPLAMGIGPLGPDGKPKRLAPDVKAFDRIMHLMQQRMALEGFDVKTQMHLEQHRKMLGATDNATGAPILDVETAARVLRALGGHRDDDGPQE